MDQPITPTPPKKSFPKWPFVILVFLLLGTTSFLIYQNLKLQKQISQLQTTASSTPLVSPQLSAEAETANWKTYTDTENNYRLSYPSTWKTDNTIQSYLQFIPPDEGPNNEGRIVIVVNASSGSLNQSMETVNPATGTKNSDIYVLVRQIQIGGENGILTKGGCCGFFGQHAFFQYKDKTYHLTLQGPIDNPQTKFQSVFDQILSTFKFLGQNSQTSSCTPKFKVESGPELTASEAYSQKCYEAKTKEECEKVDIYRESTQNFGNSDGIPDCLWSNQ